MTTVATTKMTFGAILGAVSTTTQSVVDSFTVLNTLVAKAQLSATDSLREQQINSVLDQATLKQRLVEQHTNEAAERELKIQTFIAQSPKHAEIYQKHYNRYADLMKQFD